MSISYDLLDKSKVYVAFSSGDTFISKAIKWFTRSIFSHSFILYWDKDYQVWQALGENFNGFVFTPATAEHTLAVAEVPVDLWIGLRKNVNELGSLYAYGALVGMVWVEIGAHVFGRKWHNPFVSNSNWFCSEMCTKLLIDSGMAVDLVPGDTDPQMLYDFLKQYPGVVFLEVK